MKQRQFVDSELVVYRAFGASMPAGILELGFIAPQLRTAFLRRIWSLIRSTSTGLVLCGVAGPGTAGRSRDYRSAGRV